MKKKLKSELVSLAHQILKLDADTDLSEMQITARRLYETLSVLAFAEKHFGDPQPTINKASIIEAIENKAYKEVKQMSMDLEEPSLRVETDKQRIAEITKANEKIFEEVTSRKKKTAEEKHHPQTDIHRSQESLHEPVTEKIKDLVAQMPPESDEIDEMFQRITGNSEPMKNDKNDIGEYGNLPEFERKKEEPTLKSRSVNDKLTKGLSFGLNDRIAFIKHLFEGSASDYNRVLSQLNTVASKDEALVFINTMVKPDYNNWRGKETYENRFKELIEKKFD